MANIVPFIRGEDVVLPIHATKGGDSVNLLGIDIRAEIWWRRFKRYDLVGVGEVEITDAQNGEFEVTLSRTLTPDLPLAGVSYLKLVLTDALDGTVRMAGPLFLDGILP